jgi:phosphosulfolactate synthase (CoM biosynthesis protein A)
MDDVVLIDIGKKAFAGKVIPKLTINAIAEVGVAYGISEQEEIEVDVTRLLNTFRQFEAAGAWMLLLESEGITESVKAENRRWDIVSKVAASFPLDRIMFEAEDKAEDFKPTVAVSTVKHIACTVRRDARLKILCSIRTDSYA